MVKYLSLSSLQISTLRLRVKTGLALFLLSCIFFSMGIPDLLNKKLDEAIKSAYGITDYKMNVIRVPDDLARQAPAELSENLFELISDSKVIGYVYVGTAPSMKDVFDYTVLFNPDLSIKKAKVLIYRENFGRQIGTQRWLRQFIGLSANDKPVYGKNVAGISGATISAKSMTKAVAEVLQSIGFLRQKHILP